MKKTAILCTLFLSLFLHSHAQVSWQWAHAGGSAGPLLSGTEDQDIEDITTDKWGNVYVISDIYTLDVYVDTASFPGFGSPNARETCIACFRCDGSLKWYKMIIGSDAEAEGIRADTMGGVYVTGSEYVSAGAGDGGPNSGYIMNATTIDTVFAAVDGSIGGGTKYRAQYVAKLDTGGSFKWFRWIEPDTTTIWASYQSRVYEMSADPSGDLFIFCMLKPGIYGNTYVVPDSVPYGPYILKYDRDGNCTGGIALPITSKHYDAWLMMERDSKRNRFYFDGYSGGTAGDTAWLGGEMISGTFLACFNDTGGMLWMAHDSMTGPIATVQNRVALDRFGNVYMTGWSEWGLYFNGTEFTGGGAFLVKVDTDGHNVWVSQCANNDAVQGYGVAISNDTVAVSGMYSTNFMTWGADTIGAASIPYQTFVCRLDANTGAGIFLDTIKTDGGQCFPGHMGIGSITADQFGNFYVGGMFLGSIYTAGDTLMNRGAYSNWWVAKLGTANCETPVIELETKAQRLADVMVFPNPSFGDITIKGAEAGTIIQVLNMHGQLVYSGIATDNTTTCQLPKLPAGCYLLRLADGVGNRESRMFVLE